MEFLEDNDVYLVKLPNQLKQLLRHDPATFTLGSEDEIIGLIENLD